MKTIIIAIVSLVSFVGVFVFATWAHVTRLPLRTMCALGREVSCAELEYELAVEQDRIKSFRNSAEMYR